MRSLRPQLRAILILGLLMFLPGCPALLHALSAASQGSQWLSSAIDVADAGQAAYFARHPSQEREPQVHAAIRQARTAAAALDSAIATAESVKDKDVSAAKDSALAAYKSLRELLLEMGVLDATPPEGGAETEAPYPEPFELPLADDIGKHL